MFESTNSLVFTVFFVHGTFSHVNQYQIVSAFFLSGVCSTQYQSVLDLLLTVAFFGVGIFTHLSFFVLKSNFFVSFLGCFTPISVTLLFHGVLITPLGVISFTFRSILSTFLTPFLYGNHLSFSISFTSFVISFIIFFFILGFFIHQSFSILLFNLFNLFENLENHSLNDILFIIIFQTFGTAFDIAHIHAFHHTQNVNIFDNSIIFLVIFQGIHISFSLSSDFVIHLITSSIIHSHSIKSAYSPSNSLYIL
ncbi:MAG: hypothetical protein B6229_00610 [Spirochaetaceae bacterium 4572_7]|nr:MAG: hypothetical protein B6229_00610 [Spirochaetaceae bacterium 4572_7]